MIWITGDIHGNHDIQKLSESSFPQQNSMTRDDYVIICGDFGLLWSLSPIELELLDWLESRNFTTLWIDGNHENFTLLSQYPVEDWHGGKVQRIREHILHLCRGSMFDIDGQKFFAFGGAESHDKKYRIKGVSIWDEELPSELDYIRGLKTLEENGWKADVILSHTLPEQIQNERFGTAEYAQNELTKFFEVLDKKLEFQYWFSGHYHVSEQYDKRHILLYDAIVQYTPERLHWYYAGAGR